MEISNIFEKMAKPFSIIQQETEQCWKTSMIIQQKDPNVLKVFLIKRIGDEQGTIIAINMIK